MPSYILTGAPGAGKTAILRRLEVEGHVVVEEAATDVIALEQALDRGEPWKEDRFIDKVVALQQQRQNATRATATTTTTAVFFDRSPVCTLALSHYLGFTPSRRLTEEVDRVVSTNAYASTVFFVRNQGFVETTAARQIGLEDSLVFEQLHEEMYRELGFRLVDVPAAPLEERAALVRQVVERQAR
ncbi:AAA family ATPase [Saccharopolyspora sp. NPDC049426]|uniref:AAA family ATPase n=1 Tax=Saccharopolyspora sp. NPDC049426 TaxID=3155652 RepID=UPI00342A650E